MSSEKQVARKDKASRSNAISLANIMEAPSPTPAALKETLRGVTKWFNKLVSPTSAEELKFLASLAYACIAIDEDEVLKSSSPPENGEVVAIWDLVTKSESTTAVDARASGHLRPLELKASLLRGSGVLPSRPFRMSALKDVDTVDGTVDLEKARELAASNPEADKLFKQFLPLVLTPVKPKPSPGLTSGANFSPSQGDIPGPKDLAKDKATDARAQQLIDSFNKAAATFPPPTAPVSLPWPLPSASTPRPQAAVTPIAPSSALLATSVVSLPTLDSSVPGPAAPVPPPLRSIGQPVPGLSYMVQSSTPLAVATPVANSASGVVSVYFPRFFTDRHSTSRSGRLPADFSGYHSAAMAIAAVLAREAPESFNLADYVAYVAYIGDLSANNTWASVMSFDEAFREQVELGSITWAQATRSTLEFRHLQQAQSRPAQHNASGRGEKRKD
jgi:hypothetical protein